MRISVLTAVLLLSGCWTVGEAAEEYPASTSTQPVKVFILAGQSNMEGRGFPEPLAWQVTQPQYRDRYAHLIRNRDFDAFIRSVEATRDPNDPRKAPRYLWSVRHDVWINYLGKHGPLTVGYGAPREGFGPELNFGHVLGDFYDEQVLLIKCAWGGRALARGFLPPSSMPPDEVLARQVEAQNAANEAWNREQRNRIEKDNRRIEEENKTAGRKKPLKKFQPRPVLTIDEYKDQFGKDYRNMVREVHECLGELTQRFPGYRGQGYQIKGFVWFQGWNDQYQDRWLSYEKNLANLIRDIRKEFRTPDMRVVIGQMGHDGMRPDKEGSPRDYIKKAQAAVAEYPEFKGTVTCVRTDQYWDMEADAIYRGPGSWKADVEKWRRFGNDRPYHYYGSPWFFAQVGTAFGRAMVDLLKSTPESLPNQ